MNRLYHLKETLLKNIEDNLSYENLEHVLLNYNSQDGLDEWVKENFSSYIQNGRLKYFATVEPKTFNMSHSKNMVSKLATGEIVCLIDGDNYTGKDFAGYVNKCFIKNSDIFLTAIGARKIKNPRDVLGRTCFRRRDFLRVEGFDEQMLNYGFEDYDFCKRLELAGLKRKVMLNKKYLKAISHTIAERIENTSININLQSIFIGHINPFKSEILFLFKNRTFSYGVIINNYTKQLMRVNSLIKKRNIKYTEKLGTSDWLGGNWEETNSMLKLDYAGLPNKVTEYNIVSEGKVLSTKHRRFFLLEYDKLLIHHLILFHSIISNRNKMDRNIRSRKIVVNDGLFGEGEIG